MQNRHSVMEQADNAFAQQHYKKAIRLYTKAIESFPTHSAEAVHCEFSIVTCQFNQHIAAKPTKGETLLQKAKAELDNLLHRHCAHSDTNAEYECAEARYQIAFTISRRFVDFKDMFYNIDRLKDALVLLTSCEKTYRNYKNSRANLAYVNTLKEEINIAIAGLFAQHAIYHLEEIAEDGSNRDKQLKNANKAYETSRIYLQETSSKTLPLQMDFIRQRKEITRHQDEQTVASRKKRRGTQAERKTSNKQNRKRKAKLTKAVAPKKDKAKKRRTESEQQPELPSNDIPLPSSPLVSFHEIPLNISVVGTEPAPEVLPAITPATAPALIPSTSDVRFFPLKKRPITFAPEIKSSEEIKPSEGIETKSPETEVIQSEKSQAPQSQLPSSSPSKSRLDSLLSTLSNHQAMFKPLLQARPPKSSSATFKENLAQLLKQELSTSQIGSILEGIAKFIEPDALHKKDKELASACLALYRKASLFKSIPDLESYKNAFIATFGIGDYFEARNFVHDPSRLARYKKELRSTNNQDFFWQSIQKFIELADFSLRNQAQPFYESLINHIKENVIDPQKTMLQSYC